MFNSLWPCGLQHPSLVCPSLSPRICSDSCTLSRWCYLTISFSATPFSFCLQYFPASGAFPMSGLVVSGGQRIGASALASALPVNIQSWFPSRLTGLISLQSKALWRVFSSTTVQKHQFFGAQPSLWSNSHIHIWLLENRSFDCSDTLVRTPGHGVTELPDWQSYGYTRRWSTPPSRGQWPLN